MAEKPSFNRTTPFVAQDAQRASRNLGLLSLPAFGQGVPYIPLGGSKRLPTEEEFAAQATRTKAIEDKSRRKNDAEGRPPRAATDETIAREIRRLNEQTRAFQYRNPYFAGPQVGLFIADRWLTNAITVEYTESSTDAPVYGYASRHFDAVMQGNVIVQGSFTIAYTGTDYLGSFLARYSESEGQNDGVSAGESDPITRAKRFFWGLDADGDANALVPLNFRHRAGPSGSVGRGFDIRVFYGAREFLENPESAGANGPVEIIKDVHLTGRSMIVQPSGDPIGEAWTFFASHVTTAGSAKGNFNVTPMRVHPRSGDVTVPTAGTQGVVGLGQTVRLGFPNQ